MKGTKTHLNVLFGVRGLRQTLVGTNYKSGNSVFPILAAFVAGSTEWVKEAPLTEVYVPYSEPMMSMKKDEEKE